MKLLKFLKSDKLAVALFISLVVLFLVTINFLRANFVWADDVDILRTLKETVYASTITEQFVLLFKQHNVHRVPVTRGIFFLLQQSIGLKMVHIMYIADVFYFGILALFYLLFRQEKRISLFYFLPVAIAMLSLANIKNATWAMASIQNIGVQFFVVLCIYALVKKRSVVFVIGAAAVASLTSLTGFIVWGLAAFYYFFTKEFRRAAIVTFVALMLYFTYKIGMEKAIDQGYMKLLLDFPANLVHVSAFVGQLFLITTPKLLFKGIFIENLLLVITMLGVFAYMIRLLLLYAVNRTSVLSDIAVATILYFIFIGLCGVMSLVIILNSDNSFFTRAEIKIPDRYIIHSLIFFCFFYLLLVSGKSKKATFIIGLLLAVAVNVGHAYANFDTFLKRKKLAEVDYFYLKHHGVFYSHLEKEGYYIACESCLNTIFEPLEKQGAQLFPNYKTNFDEISAYERKSLKSELNFVDEDYYYFKGLTVQTEQPTDYFILKSEKNTYVLPSYQNRNSPRNAVKKLSYFSPTNHGSIFLSKVEPGTYTLSLFSEKSGKCFILTNYKLHVKDADTFVKVSTYSSK